MTLGVGFGIALAALNTTATDDKKEPPKGLHIKPVFEAHERFERRTSKAFDKAIDDNRSDVYSRVRVGANATYGKDLKGQFVYQYSSNPYWTRNGNFST